MAVTGMLFAERGREGAGPARQRKTRGCLLGLDLGAGGAGASLRFASRGATREGPKPGGAGISLATPDSTAGARC